MWLGDLTDIAVVLTIGGIALQFRLMNDYGVDWPIWSEEGLCDAGEPQMPVSLAREVRSWASSFNENYSPQAGWPTEREARVHKQRGEQLVEAIARTLPRGDEIVLGYWETQKRKGL